jgi:hypothetical protein
MNNEQRISPGVVATIGFAVVISVAVGVVLLMRQIPSEERLCNERCAQYNKRGDLVYVYPPETTAGMRGKGPRECRCI